MGELHLEIIMDRMKREFKVEVNQGAPQVAYKEAFTKSVEHREVYKKQSGGKGKFADVQFEIGPAEDPENQKEGVLEFVDEIKGGVIPKEFVPAIKKGFEEAMKNGVLAGFPVVGMRVRVFFGSFHSVDSDAISFEMAAKMGYKDAGKRAGAKILEPIMDVEVVCPEEFTGSVIGDLNRRRGMPKGQQMKGTGVVIKADVPLSELFGYVTSLRTITSGRGAASLTFSHYSEVPNNIAEQVIADVKGMKTA